MELSLNIFRVIRPSILLKYWHVARKTDRILHFCLSVECEMHILKLQFCVGDVLCNRLIFVGVGVQNVCFPICHLLGNSFA